MDPLAAIVRLLRPRTVFTKLIHGSGSWGVRYSRVETAGFGLVLMGECSLSPLKSRPVRLAKGDFVLLPPNPGFTIYSDPSVVPVPLVAGSTDAAAELRHGDQEAEASFTLLGGYFSFEPSNAMLLTSLLPAYVHIQGTDLTARRLGKMTELIAEEALDQRPGRDLILERLVEALLVEVLRSPDEMTGMASHPGLLRGLADPNLAIALRQIHAGLSRQWTMADLAKAAGLSRSTFAQRFKDKVGTSPMEYVVQWRMAIARDLLLRERSPFAKVAEVIGYESASAFSTAFRREHGMSPSRFRQANRAIPTGAMPR